MVTIVCFRSVLVFLAFIPELCLGSCGSLRFISSVLLALLVWTFDVYALAKIAKKSPAHIKVKETQNAQKMLYCFFFFFF